MPLMITRTKLPSKIILVDDENEQFFTAENRTGALFSRHWVSVIESFAANVIRLDRRIQSEFGEFGSLHAMKIRHVWIDDKNGMFVVNIDYLHDQREEPLYDKAAIQDLLQSGVVVYDGQPHDVEVEIKSGLFSSDYFSPVGDEFYK